jgi:hypothetical protein
MGDQNNNHQDPNELIYQARCSLRGLKNLTGEQDEVVIKGYDLCCLLSMIETNLSQALELIGGDPDK